MPAVVEVARNDFGKYLKFTVTDADGTAIDLTGLTVTFKAAKPNASSAKVSGSCSFSGVDESSGECIYTLQDGDFDEVGEYHCELTIQDDASSPTYVWSVWQDTSDDQLIIRVKKDLPRESS